MKHIRTIFLTFLTVVLAVTVSACRKSEDSAAETSTEHEAEDVMNFATILHDAKSLNYESYYYTKNLQKFRQTRKYSFAMFGRQGSILFEPQTYLEKFYREWSDYDESKGDKDKIDEKLLRVTEPYYFWFRLLQYSPSKGNIYVRYKDDRRELGWKTTAEWSKSLEGIYEEKDPEVGHSDEFYKLCETFADQFTKTEDEQFVFLDLKGNATDNYDVVSAFRSTFLDSGLFETEKDSITSIDLQIHLVLEKMENGEFKLVPNEVNISIDTQYDNKETKTKMSTVDNFQLYISGINQVNEIVAPDPVKQLMTEGK